jgi:hypothetical protein
MILHIHSDASYLSVSNARSRLGGLFFCGDKSPQEDNLNGSILNVASVIKIVVANSLQVLRGCVKLRLLPQPQLRARTYAETHPSTRGDTQLKSVLARVCSVSRQILNTTTVP